MKKDQHDESVISKMETQQREKSADSGGSNLSPGSKIDSQIMNIGMGSMSFLPTFTKNQ